MKREDGFYWVKSEGKWIVAELESYNLYNGKQVWFLSGIELEFTDEDFEQIGEQIKKPED